jgi:hypothetical protein
MVRFAIVSTCRPQEPQQLLFFRELTHHSLGKKTPHSPPRNQKIKIIYSRPTSGRPTLSTSTPAPREPSQRFRTASAKGNWYLETQASPSTTTKQNHTISPTNRRSGFASHPGKVPGTPPASGPTPARTPPNIPKTHPPYVQHCLKNWPTARRNGVVM